MRIALIVRVARKEYLLFGFNVTWKELQPEYDDGTTRTTIAFMLPGSTQEGTAIKLLGYDKITKVPE